MRVCIVYDCHFPHTIGGAERWYAALAAELAAAGHEVTYLTMRQWRRGEAPAAQYRIVAVAPRMNLYTRSGRRRVLPPLVFGLGVLWHLLRHGGRYDAVHTASFPYFSLLAAGLVRRLRAYALVADWHEVWSAGYWRSYLGRAGGPLGHRVQRLCARLEHRAFCFSQLHGRRLQAEGYRGAPTVLRGEYADPPAPGEPLPAAPEIVFAGRLIPEKQAALVVAALASARQRLPDLRARIFGEGPDLTAVEAAVRVHRLEGSVDLPGFVPEPELDAALRRALCLVLPSRREGYGMVVLEAAARGVPAVVVAGEDNAAVEFISEGQNGFVVSEASPEQIALAIEEVAAAGQPLRERTAAWWAQNRDEFSLETSLRTVTAAYSSPAG